MKQNVFSIFIVFLLVQAVCMPLNATVRGSTTTPSVQPFFTFPTADPTNEMLGFGAFTSGFALTNANTRCIFNSFFPVYGPITLNNGLINQLQDWTLGSNVTFINGGSVNGNNFALNFPAKISSFSIDGMTFGNVNITMNSDVVCTSVVTFTNTCVVEGNGYRLDLSLANAKLAVGNNASLLLKDVIIDGTAAGKIYCTDNVSTITLENVTWILDANYSFTQGTLVINNQVAITGGKVFAYQSTKQSTISSNAQLFFDTGMTFSYSTNAANLINLQDSTATLRLYETTLYSNVSGLNFTKGNLIIDGVCPLLNDGTTLAQGISIGDGVSAANNVNLTILAESGFNIRSGFFVYKNV